MAIPYIEDKEKLKEMSHELGSELKILEKKIYHLAGEEFNINSPKQLSHILFTKMGIAPPKKTTTGYSTSAEVLEELKEKVHSQEETINHLRMLVSETKKEEYQDVAGQFEELVKKQGEQFQKLMESFARSFKKASPARGARS